MIAAKYTKVRKGLTSSPKGPIPVFILQICVPVKYHQGALSFQISHKAGYCQIQWNAYQHIDMIRA